MEQLHRAISLLQLLSCHRHPLSAAQLCARLECSPATLKRLITTLREDCKAPIHYSRSANGYHLDRHSGAQALPGLWFNESELYALLMAEQLFADVSPGVLAEPLAALKRQVQHLLGPERRDMPSVRVATVARQPVDTTVFGAVMLALKQQRQLQVGYTNAQGQSSERWLSPQQLCWYRDNWYLAAWCHKREQLLLFMLSRMASASLGESSATAVDGAQVDALFSRSYGIFGGEPVATAELHFAADAAPWVQSVEWHPEQQMQVQADGRIRLRLPYSDDRELLRDILRFGRDVEVIAPPELRQRIADELTATAKKYAGG